MTFGSICSGIEAASVAWNPIGWKAAWFAEIDKFPSAVLKYHYPEVENLGDFTRIDAAHGPIDLIVGGTPCQDFSVAGLRAGMDGERGNLTLEFIKLVGRLRPRWVVWENVPGVLSIDGGRALGAFLGGLAELGYGFAYRVLDAQYFGLAQRRARVFVVGYFGDWRRAAAVLFDSESLCGYPPPSREARQSPTHELAPSLTSSGRGVERGGDSRGQDPVVAMTLNAKGGMGRIDAESETFVTAPLTGNPYGDHESRESLLVAHALRADGFDASEDGTGRGTPLVPIVREIFECLHCGTRYSQPADYRCPTCNQLEARYVPAAVVPILEAGARTGKSTTDARAGIGIGEPGDPMFTLQSGKQHAVAFDCKASGRNGFGVGDTAPTLRAMGHLKTHSNAGGQVATLHGVAVRRLTPRECERLQGFPDDYSLVPYRGKLAADGPRYKALGNSMAVPVMRHIGERIQLVEGIIA